MPARSRRRSSAFCSPVSLSARLATITTVDVTLLVIDLVIGLVSRITRLFARAISRFVAIQPLPMRPLDQRIVADALDAELAEVSEDCHFTLGRQDQAVHILDPADFPIVSC